MLYQLEYILKPEKSPETATNPAEAAYSLLLKMINKYSGELSTYMHDFRDIKPFSFFMSRRDNSYLCTVNVFDDDLFYGIDYSLKKFQTEIGIVEFLGAKSTIEYARTKNKLINYEDIIHSAKPEERDKIRFLRPTSFRKAGNRQILFPLPEMVFWSILRRWNKFSGIELNIERQVFDNVLVSAFDIRTRMEKFSDAPIKGFVGWIEYSLKRLPPQLRQLIMILSYFGQFSGVGYKTTMNMGKIKVIPTKDKFFLDKS